MSSLFAYTHFQSVFTRLDTRTGFDTVRSMSTLSFGDQISALLGRIGLPEPSVDAAIEQELKALFLELGIGARMSSLRHRRVVIESNSLGASVLKFSIDQIKERANQVAPGSVETVSIRSVIRPAVRREE